MKILKVWVLVFELENNGESVVINRGLSLIVLSLRGGYEQKNR